MNIVHLNTHDASGGAARAASRLHLGLLQAGHDSRMVVAHASRQSDRVAAVVSNAPLARTLAHRLVSGASRRLSLQNVVPWPRAVLGHPFVRSAGIVNLHNIHGDYLPVTLLASLSRRRLVVWTLHDMWPLTGHCSYSLDCERWRTGCGACPRLEVDVPLRRDTTALHWRLKRWAYRGADLTVVAPSRWLADVARRSPLLGCFPVRHIPYGLDTDVFRPLDKAMARTLLGLPIGPPLALFVADNAADPRKGARSFVEALDRLPDDLRDEMGVILLGQNTGAVASMARVRWWDLGTVSDDRLLAAVYSAADVSVCPTLADNLPNTVLESMACGTPVVAFDAGGVADLVRPMETGCLAPAQDAGALAHGLEALLTDSSLRARLGEGCRAVARREYDLSVQAERYGALYRELAAARRSVRQEAGARAVTS
ncbi:MAG: glycosyltransferase family 4 protein [Dehalococcoidia bacterium]